ncbi:hypothetical protein PACTADRAFT_30989 [Pachysolen tannophilus NRRL Y-2460]|uniref:Zn(2)-C6 fungal-type domain-containing protein n=1 Tax=Pachysolen tannophilus NRRL Y-2460 TaxID=669874 RepID=A0A1E4U0M5_PACTA|nr:hypothetical protein PACTADRAFT_30989 [Pachysolen tannophilus NRRL Y-2460]
MITGLEETQVPLVGRYHSSMEPDIPSDEQDTRNGTFSPPRKRSKNGCLTCKIRKKRCDEIRPTCGDCTRLKKPCEWLDPNMPEDEARQLKLKMEKLEAENKTRKRRKMVKTLETKDDNMINDNEQMDALEKLVFRPFTFPESVSEQFSPLTDDGDALPLDSDSLPNNSNINENYSFPKVEPTLGRQPLQSLALDLKANLGTFSPLSCQSPFSGLAFLKKIEDVRDDKIQELNNDNNNEAAKEEYMNNLFEGNLSPTLPQTPSFLKLTNLRYLDGTGLQLYQYYRDKLARIISVVPEEENLYLKIFLPMAEQDLGILYGIIAWSGFHVGNEFYENQGLHFIKKALNHINENPIDVGGNNNVTRELFDSRLATYLILCSAEICSGDVKKWSYYLSCGAKMISSQGINSFNSSKHRHWLVTNFAYHDILTSSINERGMHFDIRDYEQIINLNTFGLDPLHGISKPLFHIIGEINNLAMESKSALIGELGDDLSVNLSKIVAAASILERKIDSSKPSPHDLTSFTKMKYIELQLTLFETFQLTCKLHLRHSVLRQNPNSLEIRLLVRELMKRLDVVLDTSVEGCLCFPLFIAGMNCPTESDRQLLLGKFKEFNKRYRYGNVERAGIVMEQVWMIDPTGDKCVDWYEVVKKLNWDLSFA